ncbi:chromate transporter [Arenibaculum pallidiluteum]|nr:chromate transporter [Arenibaculum pallidiluteum]
MALSWIYAGLGNVGLVQGLFFGLKAAVLAVVLEAVLRIGRRALRNRVMVGIAAAAFVGIFQLDVPFPAIILGAGLLGFLGGRAGLPAFLGPGGHRGKGPATVADSDTLLGEGTPAHARPGIGWSLRIGLVLLALWLVPTALLVGLAGGSSFAAIAVFFSKMAVVTFGGAYAVLAYVAQQAVETYGWLRPGEMLDGLGMAETTPGPLIMVTQFVGFLGAYRDPGPFSPMVAGTLGGLLTTWVTFAPCFLWIFLGAPFVETLRGNRALSAALSAITAAVVGVILNLAIWFALHVLFAEVEEIRLGAATLDVPVLASVNWAALALTAAAVVAVFRFGAGMMAVLAACSAAGIALHLAGLGA